MSVTGDARKQVKITDEAAEWIADWAEAENRTFSNMVDTLLWEALLERGDRPEPSRVVGRSR